MSDSRKYFLIHVFLTDVKQFVYVKRGGQAMYAYIILQTG